MRPPPSRVWYIAAERIARQKANSSFTNHQEKVLDYLWEHFPGLYLGSPHEAHSKETILAISREISKNVAASDKRHMFDFLARGFEQGNLSLPGWDVPLGPVYVKINREENFSRQDRFRPLDRAEKFIEAFRSSLESPQVIDRKPLLGQLLVSAILFGGLLDRKWLRPFQECIQEKRYYQERSIVWIDMVGSDDRRQSEPHSTEPNRRTRRLVPDHLTRLLLYRYHQLGGNESQQTVARDPWDNISAFIHGQSWPKTITPTSLNEMFAWAFARYLISLPHSLVAYASGKLKAESLPVAPWLRTLSGMTIPVPKTIPEYSYEHLGARPQIATQKHAHRADQLQLLSDLLKSLRFNKKTAKTLRRNTQETGSYGKISPQKARRTINVFMHHNRPQMGATLQLLLHWALRLLTEKVSRLELRKKQSIRPVSVDRYLLSIGYPLLSVAGNLQLHNLEPRDLETVYEQVALRLGKNGYALQRLRQFHGFMQVFFGVQAMEWGDMMGADVKLESAVNANIITYSVYHAVLRALGWGQAEITRWQRLHIIAVMLIYRCGLRPSEVQALRLKDVQGITIFEILIRNSQLNTVKTNAGIRRIPVSFMLSGEELELIIAFFKVRLKEDLNFGSGLLLTHPVHCEGLLSDEELFEPIRKLLKTITRDESLRLYHLRHSLLTWAGAALLLDEGRYKVELPENVPSADEVEGIRNLFTYLYGNEATGRKGMYLLAMFAGHASPETTCHHYCHLFDLMLWHNLNIPEACFRVNYKMVMAMTGLQRSVAYDLLDVPDDKHPLHNVVSNEVPKFSEVLRHPLMGSARSIKVSRGTPTLATSLPAWEEAIALLDSRKLAALRRSRDEWDFAAAMYEAIRGLDGKKMKTARKVVTLVRERYSERYGGVTIGLVSQARLLMHFLKGASIPESFIVAIFHAAKRLTLAETERAKNNWAHEMGIAHSRITTGECVPAKLGVRTMVTVKIRLDQNAVKKVRVPRMSYGFMVAMDLLYRVESENWSIFSGGL